VLDIVSVLNDEDDYTKTRNYWKYLKTKLKKDKNELVSVTNQLKLLARDGKHDLSDMLDYHGIIALGKEFPGKKANRLIDGSHLAKIILTVKVKQKLMLFMKVLY
jgi:cell filamentation protein